MSPEEHHLTETASRQRGTWASNADDWAGIQEPLSLPLYSRVFTEAGVRAGTRLLDAGCGGGFACRIASDFGAVVTGVDVTPRLIEIARSRVRTGTFLVGEIEKLPVADGAFDVVSAFASIMFAADPLAAMRELKRVAAPEGVVAAVVPAPARSDWWAFIGAVLEAMPIQPEEGRATVDLSDGPALEALFREAGLDPHPAQAIDVTWSYRDRETMLRAVLSPGPMAGASGAIGADQVRRIALSAMEPFRAGDGSYHLNASATVVVGAKPA